MVGNATTEPKIDFLMTSNRNSVSLNEISSLIFLLTKEIAPIEEESKSRTANDLNLSCNLHNSA